MGRAIALIDEADLAQRPGIAYEQGMHRRSLFLAAWSVAIVISLRADGLEDNKAENVRRMPPPGVAIGDADRAELTKGAAELKQQIDEVVASAAAKPSILNLVSDVEIFHKAVDWALRYDEFYSPKQVDVARELLQEGGERVRWLRQGLAPWTRLTGLVVRGYRSKIDGSVQPYGLVVPDSFATSPGKFI